MGGVSTRLDTDSVFITDGGTCGTDNQLLRWRVLTRMVIEFIGNLLGKIDDLCGEVLTRLFTAIDDNSDDFEDGGVNTMTEKTATFGLRLPNETKEKLTGKMTRMCLESMVRQIDEGEIELTEDGVKYLGSVNTKVESVNTCDGCPYIENALDTSKLDEVCEFKGLDRQKALDRCVQVLWR